MTDKKYPPSVSFWINKYGDLQVFLTDEAKVERARKELRDLADSLQPGMYMSAAPNKFRKEDRHPTHRLTAYFPKTGAGTNIPKTESSLAI